MSIITAYIGASHFCLMLYKSKDDYSFFYSPYVYLREVFSNYSTEQDFYINIIKLFCKNKKVSFEDCNIFISGFINTPHFNLENVKSIKYEELLISMTNIYPVLVNDFSFATKFFMTSYTSYNDYYQNDYADSLKLNKSVYKNLKATSISSQLNLDNELVKNVHQSNIKWDQNSPVVFTDSRFYSEENNTLDYLLMFSLINQPGIYDVYVDRIESCILITMLNIALNKNELEFNLNDIEHVGTLVTSTNNINCILSSHDKDPYGVLAEPDSLQKIKLDGNKEYDLVVNNEKISNVSKKIKNGTLGLILDTRENKQKAFYSTSNYDLYLKLMSN